MKRATNKSGWYRTLGISAGALAASVFVSQAWAGSIVGTQHDLSGNTYTGGEICIVCHTPHNADVSQGDAPLWNHTATTQTYTLYESSSLDAADLDQPAGVSKLCLSCHDGTVAIDSFGTTPTNTSFMTGDPAIGSDGLSNDHPVSFTYDTALANLDGELADPATTTVTVGTTPSRTGTLAEVMLFGAGNDQIECSSCHDVHNTLAAGPKLLLVNQAGSALCLTCHTK